MPLSQLFRIFPKKQPVEIQDPSLPAHLKRARQAALEILSLLQGKLVASDGSPHAGTMLAAAAWLTGTSLYRSFEFKQDDPFGTIINSNEVSTVWESLMRLLELYNFDRSDIPVSRLMMAAMGAPDLFRPEVEMHCVQREFQGQYNAVMKKHGFQYLDGTRVGIILCSMLIQEYHAARMIDAEAATGLVAEKILEAAKTIPPPLIH